MAIITLQARQADGTWAVRNAFVNENKEVQAGSMQVADLEAKARKLMAQWQATMQDGKTLRVHNSDNDAPGRGQKPKAKPHATIQYGHWDITVSQRHAPTDYAPFSVKSFPYPIGPRGPIDSADTERAAIAFFRSLGGEPKGPFFYSA